MSIPRDTRISERSVNFQASPPAVAAYMRYLNTLRSWQEMELTQPGVWPQGDRVTYANPTIKAFNTTLSRLLTRR